MRDKIESSMLENAFQKCVYFFSQSKEFQGYSKQIFRDDLYLIGNGNMNFKGKTYFSNQYSPYLFHSIFRFSL